MAYTLQQVADLARQPLEDDDKVRYTDAVLLSYLKSALLLLRNRRPDLFYGTYTALTDISAMVIGDTFPLDDEYAQPVADYVTGRASTHDSDHVESGRVKQFFEMFGMAT